MIRRTTVTDAPAIAAMVTGAFGQDAEAKLVARLRAAGCLTCELVAEEDGGIVGHIAFSPVRIDLNAGDSHWWGLAPLAVAPAWQRRGVGAALVRAGLDTASRADATLVVVLGEPAYYGRFGFTPAERLQLGCVYEVPGEYFMAWQPHAAVLPSGTVHYDAAFDGL